ncbi:hypothetical protein TRFO_17341 [Tritrichomonas foetus]|uniref:Uncharacterized protein n=1 Tax=Tritrichomonas foetus TaxID=1144522 RepID=A0A1J4KNB1_9EUKA|nr:hypothetical protein TRFO_17341 [Tritrichomonas foetus]|eukprot:OHT12723.1 hypothetical protein TRFO_17341 [Tritrichomonas foetus]
MTNNETDEKKWDPEQFIKIIMPKNKKGGDSNRELDSLIRKLKKILDRFVQISQVKLPKLYTFDLDNFNGSPFYKARFCFAKLKKLQRRLQFHHNVFYSKVTSTISRILYLLQNCDQSKTSFSCDLKALNSFIENEYVKDEKIILTKKKIQILNEYANKKLYLTPTHQNISSENQILSLLNDSLQFAQKECNYCQFSPFDRIFDLYVLNSPLKADFEIVSNKILNSKTRQNERLRRSSFHLPKAMSKSCSCDMLHEIKRPKKHILMLEQYTIDLSEVSNLVETLNSKLNFKSYIKQDKMPLAQIVLTSAITRILFENIYLTDVNLFNEKNIDFSEFEHKCNVIRWASPRNLKISPSIINKNSMDTPFVTLASCSPDLQIATSFLQDLHFLTNPLDIIFSICQSIKCIECFILKSTEENQKNNKGNDPRINAENKTQQAMENNGIIKAKGGSTNYTSKKYDSISFDDFFSVFWPTFSISPASNCLAISSLLLAMVNYPLLPPFDFARFMFTSAVDYTIKVELKELMPHHFIDTAHDPLNIG